MLELGQPLHFFDYAKIADAHIIVRDARPGEHLTTLDGVDRALDPTALLIADEQQATGLAGLMGGLISEVDPTTREIVIESANFSGPRVRRMSVKLGLRSEASTRNEKNLPPALTDLGAARAAVLLAAEGGTVRAPQAFGAPLAAAASIAFPKTDVQRLLGFTLADDAVTRALASLGFSVEDKGAAFAVTAPPWRSDIAIAADIVEEIARVVGYDRLESAMPVVGEQPLSSAAFERDNALANVLAGLGYRECITLGLQPLAIAERDRALGLDVPAVVEITNPLSDDQRYLRYAMVHAHLGLVARDRLRPYRTFEIGHVFEAGQPDPLERNVATIVAATARADEPAWRSTPFGALNSDVLAAVRALTGVPAELERTTALHLHPGKTAAIVVDGMRVGVVGVVDPRLTHAYEIADDVVAAIIDIAALPAHAILPFVAPSRFPASNATSQSWSPRTCPPPTCCVPCARMPTCAKRQCSMNIAARRSTSRRSRSRCASAAARRRDVDRRHRRSRNRRDRGRPPHPFRSDAPRVTLAWPDLIIGGITVFFALKGYRKGFVSELAGAVALFIAIVAAFRYNGAFDRTVTAWTGLTQGSAHAVGLLAFAIFVYAIVMLIAWLLGRIAKLPMLGLINGLLGALIGGIKALVGAGFVLYVILFFPLPTTYAPTCTGRASSRSSPSPTPASTTRCAA